MTTAYALSCRRLGPIVVLAAFASTAAAQPVTPLLSQCIDPGATWTAHDDHQILVSSHSRNYLVTTENCPRMTEPFTHLTVVAPGGAPICDPHDVHLYVSGGPAQISTPCIMQSIRPLSRDEARTLAHSKP